MNIDELLRNLTKVRGRMSLIKGFIHNSKIKPLDVQLRFVSAHNGSLCGTYHTNELATCPALVEAFEDQIQSELQHLEKVQSEILRQLGAKAQQ